MIIINLQGGLGNQMFQYAFGKTLSTKLKIPLYFDLSFYELSENAKHTIRSFDLGIFEIPIKVAPKNKIRGCTHPAYAQRCLNSFGLFTKSYFKESPIAFNEYSLVFNSAYFDGYWQSEKYFKSFSELIRNEFRFKNAFNFESNNLSKEILKNKESVSIHIRRGDYISSSLTNKIHGVCSIKYYKEAINMMKEKLQDPFFYLFSDDIDWLQDNIIDGLNNFQIIRHNNGQDSWQDMALMTKCKHHIIANSTFSWWGAWLNPNPLKLVIAPDRWFADKNLNDQTKNLIPENWVRL